MHLHYKYIHSVSKPTCNSEGARAQCDHSHTLVTNAHIIYDINVKSNMINGTLKKEERIYVRKSITINSMNYSKTIKIITYRTVTGICCLNDRSCAKTTETESYFDKNHFLRQMYKWFLPHNDKGLFTCHISPVVL